MTSWVERALGRAVEVRADELRALLWSFAYFFFLLASYFILRPLRDEMGAAAGRDMLQWLFTGTFFAMLVAAPLFGFLVARMPRRRFIPVVYRFFMLNIALFWVLLQMDAWRVETARVFFVWVSMFNLFAVSVFWSFMADLYRTEQSKRLFGFIAAGGTAGTLLGSTVTVGLAGVIGPVNLLIVAAGLLELAVFCAVRLERAAGAASPARAATNASEGLGGSMFDGFRLILRSPYLLGLAAWVALLSLAGTFLYFMQIDVVRAASPDPATRTRIFAGMDLAANLMTIALQFVATGRLVKRIGAGPAAAILPGVFALGFVALALAPGLAVIVVFQALQRTANFAFSNPSREILFTSVEREEKYKAKSLIDTAVLRAGDVVWGWAFAGLRALGLGVTGVAAVAVPIMAAWIVVSLALGRAQERRASTGRETT